MIEYALLIIFLFGLGCLLLPATAKKPLKMLAVATASIAFIWCALSFFAVPAASLTLLFRYRTFPGLFGLAIGFYGLIVVLFSLKYADFIERLNRYYAYVLWNLAFSLATVYSTTLIGLLVFWGLSGLTLYLLADLLPGAANTAKKSFVFIGGSDALMILGVALYWVHTGSIMIGAGSLPLQGSHAIGTASFLCLLTGALTKAGAMPFHSWVPDFADDVPLTLNALLPASLDKLLGIFLIILMVQELFVINTAMLLLLLIIGGVTLLVPAFMALVQTDARRLLGYSTISQVGYILLGISCSSALGLAAAVFHLVNHTLYKSGLFLTAAAVEHRTGTTSFNRLGGLSRTMKISFIVCLVFSLSIAGIPPLNGFSSKWMIYQALFQKFSLPGQLPALKTAYLLFLVAAMFGSAVTLASFVKLLHSVFLGQPAGAYQKPPSEVPASMWFPMALLALLCVVFGLLPAAIPLQSLVLPGLTTFNVTLSPLPSFWSLGPATAMVIVAIFGGVVIALVSAFRFRTNEPFIGGEQMPESAGGRGSDFYRTVSDIGIFRLLYRGAEKKIFDLYSLGTKAVVTAGGLLSSIHTGSLRRYLLLLLAGFAALFAALLRYP